MSKDLGDLTPFFIHKSPKNKRHYQQLFDAPVFFDQEIYALKIDAKLLDIKLKSGDKRLKLLAQNYIDKLNKNHEEDTASKVQHLMRSLLSSGYCTEKRISETLQITPRTLQRRLKNQNASFKALLTSIRLELAKQYLTQSNVSMTEISHALGYSEPSAFTRFFKRETGKTPSTYSHSSIKTE